MVSSDDDDTGEECLVVHQGIDRIESSSFCFVCGLSDGSWSSSDHRHHSWAAVGVGAMMTDGGDEEEKDENEDDEDGDWNSSSGQYVLQQSWRMLYMPMSIPQTTQLLIGTSSSDDADDEGGDGCRLIGRMCSCGPSAFFIFVGKNSAGIFCSSRKVGRIGQIFLCHRCRKSHVPGMGRTRARTGSSGPSRTTSSGTS